MTTKSVLVRLRGENSDLNRALRGSSAEAKVLGKNLDDADKSSRRLSEGLELSNDRTTMLIQSALALGPALIPIGAQAVPVVMGLGTQLGFAAAAAGVTALAFSGVGDSLKAVNQYALEPTEANLQKMREEMDALGPAGRDFVRYLQDLRPQLQVLQDIAQEGILPGAEEGIESLLDNLPQLERIVSTIATTVGDLMADAGADLGGPEWRAFFDYIESDAQPILSDMARTAGNFLHGMADMVVAFGPLTYRFSEGFRGMSESFEDWAAGLSTSEGFQSFVTYIEENGPQVIETLASLGDAVLAIVESAAPVGAVALPVIETLAEAFAAIARTPIGPVLIGAAAGISAVSRAIALYQAANGSALLGSLMGGRGGVAGGAASGGLADRAFNVGAMRSALPAIRDYNAAVLGLRASESAGRVAHGHYIGAMKAGALVEGIWPGRKVTEGMTKATDALVVANEKQATAAAKVTAAEKAKKAAIRGSAVGLGKTAALVGGLAVATSGYAEKTGFANTASLALMGTLAGPWGAAIGGSIGYAMDLAAANDNLEDSFKNLKTATENAVPTMTGADALDAQVAAARAQLDEFRSGDDTNPWKTVSGLRNTAEGWFGKSDVEEYEEKLAAAERAAQANRDAAAAAQRAAIANDAYTGAVGRSGIAAGLTATAVRGLVSAMEEQKKAAVDAFGAETRWRQALKTAQAQAEKSSAGIRGSSDEAIKNRTLIETLATAWNGQSKAVKNNTARFREAKQQFIDTAVGMGVPIERARTLAKEMLDIPKQRVIQVNMQGDDAALAAIRRIKAEMAGIRDKTVRLTYYVNQVNAANRAPAPMPGQPSADGGTVPKSGLPYADRWPYLLADEEEIISNRDGQAAAFRRELKAINAGASRAAVKAMLADGGTTGAWRHPQPAPGQRGGSQPIVISAQSLAGMRIEGAVTVNGLDGHLRGVIREEIDAESRFNHVKAGR